MCLWDRDLKQKKYEFFSILSLFDTNLIVEVSN